MATSKRRLRGKWTDPGHEMVPIVGARVAAALARRPFTASALAHRIGEKQQTIHLIVTGTTRKCRLFRRDKMARALRVDREWLSGAPLFWVGIPAGQDLNQPALAQLAESDLIQKCQMAWERDPEQNTDDRYSFGFPTTVLHTLLDINAWRERLLSSVDESEWNEKASLEEKDEFTASIAQALEVMFRPWLEGKASVKYRELLGLMPRTLRTILETNRMDFLRRIGVIRYRFGSTKKRSRSVPRGRKRGGNG